jgi:hypothetical protein
MVSTVTKSFGGQWIAKKHSDVKEIRWTVGERYKVIQVRPGLLHENAKFYIMFNPVEKIPGFRQTFEISEETFIECFERV